MTIKDTISIIADIATALAFGVGVITYYFTAKVTRDQAKANTLMTALDRYVNCYDYKIDAIKNNNVLTAKTYWQSLYDLQWTEYSLWKKGYIDNDIMTSWCFSRYKEYHLSNTDIGIIITSKEVWKELKTQYYFHPVDPFVTFMDKIFSIPVPNVAENAPVEEKKEAYKQLHKKIHKVVKEERKK